MTLPQQFQVKDSGARVEFASGMIRDTNEGKPRFDLLRPVGVPYHAQFVTRVAVHMAEGGRKYTDRNWEKADGSGGELERYVESAERHLQQWACGEDDEDHAAAVVFNLLAAETLKWKMRQAGARWLQPAPGSAPLRKDLDLLANMDPESE